MDALEIGSVFAGYRIESVLGRGGMGIVYLATELELERPVALKIVAPEHAEDPGFRRRFAREAKTLAAVDHPNVVHVFRYGDADGLTFLSMSYVPGMSLADLLAARGELPTTVVAYVVTEVATALDAAHGKGLLHRDVKPSNVLLATGDVDEDALLASRVLLSDFGLSKRAGSNSLTRPGQFLGTVPYVSPEQIQGIDVDWRADQYALACVAYECLTGQTPFAEMAEPAVLMAHLVSAPPRASAVRPDVSTEVDAVIALGMAKDRSLRYASCRAFAAALGETLRPVALPAEVVHNEVHEQPEGPPVRKATDRGAEDAEQRIGIADVPHGDAVLADDTAPLNEGSRRDEPAPSEPVELPALPSKGEELRDETDRRRWFSRWHVMAAVGTISVAGTLAAAAVLADWPPGPEPTNLPAASATAEASSRGTTSIGDIVEAARRADLLQHIPPVTRASCEASDASGQEQDAADAMVDCRPGAPGSPDVARYALYPDTFSTMEAFDGLLDDARTQAQIDGSSGRCTEPPFTGGAGTYRYSERGGSLFCYADGSTATFVWTVDALHILGIATRDDGNAQALYQWWFDPALSGPAG